MIRDMISLLLAFAIGISTGLLAKKSSCLKEHDSSSQSQRLP
jgi:hypothetical protein